MEKISEDRSLILDENHELSDVWNGYTYFRDNDIVLAKITPCFENGKCCVCANLTNSIGFGTTELHVLRTSPELSPHYCCYILQSTGFREIGKRLMFGTTGQKRLPEDYVKNYVQAFPSLPEQYVIVAFLDRQIARLDALLAKKERQIALLQEKRAALIGHAVTKGLDPSAPMKDSGIAWLGEVPAHWEIKRLKQISPRISGRLVYSPARYFSEEGVPFLFGTNITENGISLENVKFIPPEINQEFIRHVLREDDLVTVRVGAPGLTTVVPKEADGLNCASLMIIRKAANFSSHWLMYSMNSTIGKTQVEMVTYGAAQVQINITDAINFLFPVPPLLEQIEIASYLQQSSDSIFYLTEKIQSSMNKLQEYRTVLISAAVTGKIDVRGEVPA